MKAVQNGGQNGAQNGGEAVKDSKSLRELFKGRTLGQIVELVVSDSKAKKDLRNYLEKQKFTDIFYKITFCEGYSEIIMESRIFELNFEWKFIDLAHMSLLWGDIHRGPGVHIYGISTTDKISPAIETFLGIRNAFPGLIENVTISSDALLPEQDVAGKCSEIIKIQEVKILHFQGTDNFPSEHAGFLSNLIFNNIKVSEQLYMNEFRGMVTLKYEKLAYTPVVTFDVPATISAEQVFAAAGNYTRLDFPVLSVDLCRNVLQLWLISTSEKLGRLTLNGPDKIGVNIEKDMNVLLDGLKFEPVSSNKKNGFRQKNFTAKSNREKVRCLEEVGLDIHREDGAKATIFFRKVGNGMSFTMRTSYCNSRPIEQQIRAMEKYSIFDHFGFELVQSQKRITRRMNVLIEKNGGEFTKDEVINNGRTLAEQTAQWEMMNINRRASDAVNEELRMDRLQLAATKERETQGYLRLKIWSQEQYFPLVPSAFSRTLQSLRGSLRSLPLPRNQRNSEPVVRKTGVWSITAPRLSLN